MSTAFEKIEKDLVRTCKNAKTTDGLATKFIQRVINNDAFGVDGFMEELKSIINNPTFNHEKVQISLKELFLDAVQNNNHEILNLIFGILMAKRYPNPINGIPFIIKLLLHEKTV